MTPGKAILWTNWYLEDRFQFKERIEVNSYFKNIHNILLKKESRKWRRGRTYEVVELDVDSVSSTVYHFERVWAKAIHVSVAIRSPQIGENEHCLVCGFLMGRDEVPVHVRILRKVKKSLIKECLQLNKKIYRPVGLATLLNNELHSPKKTQAKRPIN